VSSTTPHDKGTFTDYYAIVNIAEKESTRATGIVVIGSAVVFDCLVLVMMCDGACRKVDLPADESFHWGK